MFIHSVFLAELLIPVSGGQPYTLGTLASGTLTLTKAGATKGAAVEGSFSVKWDAIGK